MLSDKWHKHTICPACGSAVRHRLFYAALMHPSEGWAERALEGKRVLHFGPEEILSRRLKGACKSYVTTDYETERGELALDMTNMASVGDGSFDTLIAFDVLEHIDDYASALREVNRVLSNNGIAIFTVPQKDGLKVTHDDPEIKSPEAREEHYGQADHRRMYGDDFPSIVERFGFSVDSVDENAFERSDAVGQVLFPPILSARPLATNYRKIFFCVKQSGADAVELN